MYFSTLLNHLTKEKDFRIELKCLSDSIDIQDVELLDGTQKDFGDDVIYFGYASVLNAGDQPAHCILVESGEGLPLFSSADRASVNASDLFAVFNSSKQYLQKNADLHLYDELIKKANSSKSLSEVLDYASLKTGNSIVVCDMKFNILAHSLSIPVTDKIWKKNVEKGYCDYEFIQRVKSLDTVKNASSTTDAIEVTCPESPNKKCSSKIFINGIQVGFVLMIEGENKITPRHLAAMSEISKALSFTISCYRPDILPYFNQDQQVLEALLIGTPAEKVANEIKHLHFSDTMYALCIKTKSETAINKLKSRILPKLRQIFPEAYMTIHNSAIAILMPSSSSVTLVENQRILLEFMSREKIDIGISLEFSKMDQFYNAYQQALRVIEWNKKIPVKLKEKISWDIRYPNEHNPHRYSEILFYDMLSEYPNRDRLKDFVHPALKRLKEHDKESGNELYNTLKIFLRNHHNSNETAKVLNIHRNSLAYRLDKIIEISKADLDDPATEFLLQTSFKIEDFLQMNI